MSLRYSGSEGGDLRQSGFRSGCSRPLTPTVAKQWRFTVGASLQVRATVDRYRLTTPKFANRADLFTTHRCPIVAPGPTSVIGSSPPCSTHPSWMFAPARMMIGPKSALSTALYQTEALASTRTSPTRVAVGAMNAVGCTVGARPSKENSGIRAASHLSGAPDHSLRARSATFRTRSAIMPSEGEEPG